MTMVTFTSMAIARERERGTLEQLIVSPVRSVELVIGKILPYIAIGYVQMTLILVAGTLIFDVPFAGQVPTLYALASVFIAANLALGLFFSTLAKTQQDAQAAAEAAKSEMARRDAKINELEAQNTALDKQATDLKSAIGNLEKSIADTEKKLAASEGDREFLLKELKRLQA